MVVDKAILDGIADAAERKVRSDLFMQTLKAGGHELGLNTCPSFDKAEVEQVVEMHRKRAVDKLFDKLYSWCNED